MASAMAAALLGLTAQSALAKSVGITKRTTPGCYAQFTLSDTMTAGKVTARLILKCTTGSAWVTPYLTVFRNGSRVVTSKSPGLRSLRPGDSYTFKVTTSDASGTQCYKGRLLVLLISAGGDIQSSWSRDTPCLNT